MEFRLEDPLSAFYPATWEAEVEAAADEEEEEDNDNRVLPEPARSRRPRPGSIQALFDAEADQHVSTERLDAEVRRDAVSIVLRSRETADLDPLVTYLAVSYVDRFLSQRELPRDKPWIVRLLAIACLSLAAKMNKLDVSVADFQRDERYIHDSRTIRRMELVVLGALGWRMRSVTPFSFLEFFLAYFPLDGGLHLAALKGRASQIVFQSQTDTKLLEHRPSEMAVSALILAADELFPAMSPSFRAAVSGCPWVNHATLCACLQLMGASNPTTTATAEGVNDDCVAGEYPALSSSCDTPVTVLGHHHHHRHCPSSESERTLSTAAAVGTTKKARISGFIRRSTAAGCRRDRQRKTE